MSSATAAQLLLLAARAQQPRSASALSRVALRRLPSCKVLSSSPSSTSPRLAVCSSSGSGVKSFSSSARKLSDHEETFEEFTARFEKEFEQVQDVFELQRNLNNAFAYDLVPSPSVIQAALKAARRVNDYPTAVRIFEGIKAKVENKQQYNEYLEDLKPLREELGVNLKEDLYPDP